MSHLRSACLVHSMIPAGSSSSACLCAFRAPMRTADRSCFRSPTSCPYGRIPPGMNGQYRVFLSCLHLGLSSRLTKALFREGPDGSSPVDCAFPHHLNLVAGLDYVLSSRGDIDTCKIVMASLSDHSLPDLTRLSSISSIMRRSFERHFTSITGAPSFSLAAEPCNVFLRSSLLRSLSRYSFDPIKPTMSPRLEMPFQSQASSSKARQGPKGSTRRQLPSKVVCREDEETRLPRCLGRHYTGGPCFRHILPELSGP